MDILPNDYDTNVYDDALIKHDAPRTQCAPNMNTSFDFTDGHRISHMPTDKYRCLYNAIMRGEKQTIVGLTRENINLNAYLTREGRSALHISVLLGQVEITRLLLASGADPNVPEARNRVTPMFYVFAIDNMDPVKRINLAALLIKNGALYDVVDGGRDNVTPMHLAARLGDSAVVAFLLTIGASVDAITRGGFTPIMIARMQKNDNIVELLSEHQNIYMLTNT